MRQFVKSFHNKSFFRISIGLSILVFVFLLFSEYFFFRNILFSPNLVSEPIDGRLCMLITEHWFNFLRGQEKFTELAMFYPAQNVIGYTDMFLFFGVIHSFLRLLTLDIFDAFKYTLILVHLFGTFCLFYFCFKKLKMSVLWSLFATTAFSFSNTYATFFAHPQLVAVSFIPLLCLFLFNFFESYIKGKPYNLSAYLFITGFVLMAYNSWYIAFFIALFFLIFIIVFSFFLLFNRSFFSILWAHIKKLWINIVGYVIYGIILLCPFVLIYLPNLDFSGGYQYISLSYYMPKINDIFAPNKYNVMSEQMSETLSYVNRVTSFETKAGFSVVLLGMFVFMMIYSFIRMKRKFSSQKTSRKEKLIILLITSLFISCFIGILLPIKFAPSFSGFMPTYKSLWWFVYHFIPGASSIRGVSRFWLFLSCPISILTAFAADKYIHLKNRFKTITPFILLAALWISNISAHGVFSEWNKTDELNFLHHTPHPPKEAKVFFIPFEMDPYFTDPNNFSIAEFHYYSFLHHMDAFALAMYFKIKTINGYSGIFPKGWGMVFPDTHFTAVQNWIIDNKIKNIYVYDKNERKWLSYQNYLKQTQQYHLGEKLYFGLTGKAKHYIIGKFHTNSVSRNKTVQFQFFLDQIPQTDLIFEITIAPLFNHDCITEIFANDVHIDTWHLSKPYSYSTLIPQKLLKTSTIRLRLETTCKPNLSQMDSNNSQLFLQFKEMSLLNAQ